MEKLDEIMEKSAGGIIDGFLNNAELLGKFDGGTVIWNKKIGRIISIFFSFIHSGFVYLFIYFDQAGSIEPRA